MKTDARALESIVTTLEQQGDIAIHTTATPGRPGKEYELLEDTEASRHGRKKTR
jgi:hypothetical protein